MESDRSIVAGQRLVPSTKTLQNSAPIAEGLGITWIERYSPIITGESRVPSTEFIERIGAFVVNLGVIAIAVDQGVVNLYRPFQLAVLHRYRRNRKHGFPVIGIQFDRYRLFMRSSV